MPYMLLLFRRFCVLKISSEFLFLYLTSDTIQVIFESLSKGLALPFASKSDLSKTPIVIPEDADDFYREEFYISNYKTIDYLEPKKRRRALISGKEESSDLIENSLIMELLANAKTYLNNDLCGLYKHDVRELNRGYEVKVYKATVVLAG